MSTRPTLRSDIIEIASKIGTKRFAEAMPEYCGVISQHPVTNGSFTRVEKESKAFDYSVLEEAIKNAKVKNIDEVLDDVCKVGTLEVVNNLNESYIIIDIRQSSDTLNAPCKVLKIPFYDLKKEFKKLEQDKTYLLYCDKGVMSQLHGQYLKDEYKFENIKVYRPN